MQEGHRPGKIAAVPDTVREIFQLYLDQIDLLTEKIVEPTRRLKDATQENADMRWLCPCVRIVRESLPWTIFSRVSEQFSKNLSKILYNSASRAIGVVTPAGTRWGCGVPEGAD